MNDTFNFWWQLEKKYFQIQLFPGSFDEQFTHEPGYKCENVSLTYKLFGKSYLHNSF